MSNLSVVDATVSARATEELAWTDDWAQTARRLTWAFVAIGIAARLVRYLLRFPLWGDECMLADNFLTRDYVGLLQPLDHGQVAPIGYLWAELTSLKCFGFSEWSLRLVAMLSGVGGLLVFRHLAHRLLSPVPAMLAVAFYSVSYYPIRHAVEAKPYASDTFFCALLLALAVEYWRDRAKSHWMWALAAAAPVALVMSFPATFVAGGIGLGLMVTAWRSNERRAWLHLAVYFLTVAGAFLFTYWISTSAQEARLGDQMRAYWQQSFPPPLVEPWIWLKWMVGTHTGEMFAYPVGADRGGSTLTFLLCLAGAVILFRQAAYAPLLMICGTFALAYVAAALHRYPYGNTARMVQYLGPMICLLAGAGAAALIAVVPKMLARQRVLVGVLAALGAIGVGVVAHDLVHPYKHWRDWHHQGFVRWFWNQDPDKGELVCAEADLGYDFWPGADRSLYHCFRQIYSRRHQRGDQPVGVTSLQFDRPVRCVVFAPQGQSPDPKRYRAWMDEMASRYELKGRADYRVSLDRFGDNESFGVYELYQFVPWQDYPAPQLVPETVTQPGNARVR